MNLEIINGNPFESRFQSQSKSAAVLTTVKRSCSGLEDNIARSFSTIYPDACLILEQDIECSISLASAKIYSRD